MIRKLKWQFAAITMSLILIVLIGMIGAIYGTSAVRLKNQATASMQRMLEGGMEDPGIHIGPKNGNGQGYQRPDAEAPFDGTLPPGEWQANASEYDDPDDDAEDDSDDADDDSDWEDDDNDDLFDRDDFEEKKDDRHIDTNVLTTFVIVRENDGTLRTEGRFVTFSGTEAMQSMLELVEADGRQNGRIEYDGTPYLYSVSANKTAFHDWTQEKAELANLMGKLALVFVVALAAFGAITVYLAGRVVQPIQKSMQEQKRFVADASHELKTPLAVIMANLSLVQSHPESTVREEGKWLSAIQEEGGRMQNLIANLLYLAKSDDGSLQQTMKRLSLSDLAWEEMLRFETIAYEAGRGLEEKIAQDVYVTGDEDQLKRMIGNLVENAIKYSDEKGRISLRLETQAGKAVLTVHNTGQGMTEEQLQHVFERFYRADQARSRDIPGYGLGLSIVSAIVDAHHGKITVRSGQNGEGTSFIVTLPLAD